MYTLIIYAFTFNFTNGVAIEKASQVSLLSVPGFHSLQLCQDAAAKQISVLAGAKLDTSCVKTK